MSRSDFRSQYTALLQRLLVALKEATPVRTGRARRGWRIENNTIVNDVPYVVHLNRQRRFIEAACMRLGLRPDGIIVVPKD